MSLINKSHINSQHFYCPQHLLPPSGTVFSAHRQFQSKAFGNIHRVFGYRTSAPRLLAIFRAFLNEQKTTDKETTWGKDESNRLLQNQSCIFVIRAKNKTLSKASTVDRSCFENGKSQPILTANIGMAFARSKVLDLQNACKEMLHVKAPKKNETQLNYT